MSKEYVTELMSKEQFLSQVRRHNPQANLSLISKAYDFAKESHGEQKRLSGRPHFLHVQEVAYMLAKLGLDSSTICAGLLHDVIEDTKVKPEEVQRMFGQEVLSLVEGVTKIQSINLSQGQNRAESFRKIILATMKDIRVILIKLADRLHNMRTLKYQPREVQHKISKETLEVYVPIAYKLGMYKLKSELEDLSFKHLQPEIYQDLKRKIARKKEERDEDVRNVVREIKENLQRKGADAEVQGRAKHFYSIYRKMLTKSLLFDEIHDLYAVRIITGSPDVCYRILGIVHSLWHPIPGSFNDYIANPKPNMYQSIHTEVMIDNRPVEVQIRTYSMHHVAEEGIAAHWRYKGTDRDKRFDRAIAWLKQILDWTRTRDAKDFIETFKVDLFKDEIFVFTPKGDPILLPEKASPVDFAYAVHTDIGNHCERAKVNSILVPLDSELQPGDIIEIMTSKKASPSRNWLSFVKTNYARSNIRQALNLTAERRKTTDTPEEDIAGLIDADFKKSAIKISGCCSITPYESIVGYRLKDGKVAVHLSMCENARALPREKVFPLAWKTLEKESERIIVEIMDRLGIFSDILNVFSAMKMKVVGVNTKTMKDKLYILLEVEKSADLEQALQSLRQVRNVVSAKRLSEGADGYSSKSGLRTSMT